MTLKHYFLAVVFFSVANAQSQSSGEPPPSPPFVERLPANVRWEISFPGRQAVKDAQAERTQSRQIQSVQITQHGNLRWEQVAWSDGSIVERWFSGDFLIRSDNQSVHISKRNTGDDAVRDQFRSTLENPFPELDWLSRENFVRTVVYEGRPCHFYSRSFDYQVDETSPSASIQQKAWIEKDSRLPVAFENDDLLQVYKFAPSSSPLTLPSSLAEALEQYQAKLNAVEKHRMQR